MTTTLHTGDCLDVLRGMEADSVDSIVTDPPYGLSFMGKAWDGSVPSVEVWREALRVLKPGGHILAFAGTRTQHRMAAAIEDAGFEIRDMIAWVYGSGFPKSLDVSKAIDKAAGAEREVVGRYSHPRDGYQWHENTADGSFTSAHSNASRAITSPATPAARQWSGWGTALKPALEPITVARKPFPGTVAQNVLEHGTGGLNIEGCRVGTSKSVKGTGFDANTGRWPANLIHDGSDEVLALFSDSKGQQGEVRGDEPSGKTEAVYGDYAGRVPATKRGDSGSAARFFYSPKASKKDREDGLDHVAAVFRPNGNKWTDQDYRVSRGERPPNAESGPRKNVHPTVKPTDLMAYLCRLVTPPGGVVLDPFMGSGSTGRGAVLEGFGFVGIDMDPEYVEIARARIAAAQVKASEPKQEGFDL